MAQLRTVIMCPVHRLMEVSSHSARARSPHTAKVSPMDQSRTRRTRGALETALSDLVEDTAMLRRYTLLVPAARKSMHCQNTTKMLTVRRLLTPEYQYTKWRLAESHACAGAAMDG